MATRFHKSRIRRAERAHVAGHGSLNLVPLVDILTSIVFFSLLTYTGAAMALLTAFDLSLPPVVVTAEQNAGTRNEDQQLNLLLAVRIQEGALLVEHSGGVQDGLPGFQQRIGGLDSASLDSLQSLLAQVRQRYPQNEDVLVVPEDATLYDDLIHVLDRVRLAGYANVSLGNRARQATQVAAVEEVR